MWRLAEDVQSAAFSRKDWDGKCWILNPMSAEGIRTNMQMSKLHIVRTNAFLVSPIH